MFEHEWLAAFFENIDQGFIEEQQTDFMSSIMGGPRCYTGQYPQPTHTHMYITEEIFNLRSELLDRAIRAEGVEDAAREAWLKLDGSFRNAIVKASHADCKPRYSFEGILEVPKPRRKTG